MSTSTPSAPGAEARIEQLEKRLGRLTRLFGWFATLIVCLLILGVGQYYRPRFALAKGIHELEANSIRLRDANNNSLAQFDGRTLLLLDERGTRRVELSAERDADMMLRFYDKKGKGRSAIGVTKEGMPFLGLTDAGGMPSGLLTVTEDGPVLVLNEEGNKRRVLITTTKAKDGQQVSSFSLADSGGKVVLSLSTTSDGPIVFLNDENFKTHLALSMSKKDGPYIQIKDENGKERAKLDLSKEGARFTLQDAEGKPVFTKP
jgi:hypothetical protein